MVNLLKEFKNSHTHIPVNILKRRSAMVGDTCVHQKSEPTALFHIVMVGCCYMYTQVLHLRILQTYFIPREEKTTSLERWKNTGILHRINMDGRTWLFIQPWKIQQKLINTFVIYILRMPHKQNLNVQEGNGEKKKRVMRACHIYV